MAVFLASFITADASGKVKNTGDFAGKNPPTICVYTLSVSRSGRIGHRFFTLNCKQKLQAIQTLLSKIIIIDISSADTDLMNAYAEIDALVKEQCPARHWVHLQRLLGKMIYG